MPPTDLWAHETSGETVPRLEKGSPVVFCGSLFAVLLLAACVFAIWSKVRQHLAPFVCNNYAGCSVDFFWGVVLFKIRCWGAASVRTVDIAPGESPAAWVRRDFAYGSWRGLWMRWKLFFARARNTVMRGEQRSWILIMS